jgi:hypothetical protein
MNEEGRPEAAHQSRAQNRNRSTGGALRSGRAEAVYRWFACRRRPLPLDRATYWWLREDGLTKANVDRALDDLAAAGRVELTIDGGQVVVEAKDEAAAA